MPIRFDQFYDGQNLRLTDTIVGLRSNTNTIYTFTGVIENSTGQNAFAIIDSGSTSVNYPTISNSLAGNPVTLSVDGTDSSASILVKSKSDGSVSLQCPGNGDVNVTLDGNGDFVVTNTGSGLIKFNGTTGIRGVLDEDDMASNSNIDAATQQSIKAYVDNSILSGAFTLFTYVASNGNFLSTYNNGSSGVGATLTASANGFATIDGTLLSLGDLVLFKDQTNTYENGIYTVTYVGDLSSSAIYTRYTEFDEPSQMTMGYLIFTIVGNTNAKKGYQLLNDVATVGVSSVDFQQVTIAPITSSTDNALIRWSGVNGEIVKDSVAILTDIGDLTGLNLIDVGNIEITGNKIEATSLNMQLIVGGSASIELVSPTVTIEESLVHGGDTDNRFVFGTDTQEFRTAGVTRFDINNSGARFGATGARITSISTDTALTADSDTLGVTQHAVKTYVDNNAGQLPYDIILGTTTLSVNKGYVSEPILPGLPIYTLPASCNVGDVIIVIGNSAQLYQVKANTGQTIVWGSTVSSSGGYVQANEAYDVVKLTCISSSSRWAVEYSIGIFDIV